VDASEALHRAPSRSFSALGGRVVELCRWRGHRLKRFDWVVAGEDSAQPVAIRGPGAARTGAGRSPHRRPALDPRCIKQGLLAVSTFGGHGDAHISVRLEIATRPVFYADSRAEVAQAEIALEHWVPVEADDETQNELLNTIRAEIFRALGLSPEVHRRSPP